MDHHFTQLKTLSDKLQSEYTTLNDVVIKTTFIDNKSHSLSQRLTDAEGFYDKIEETYLKRKVVIQSFADVLKELDVITNQMKNDFNEVSKQNEFKIAQDVINIQISIIEEQYKIKTKPLEEQLELLNSEKMLKIEQIKNCEMYRKYAENADIPFLISLEEQDRLENLLNKKISSVVFNSDVDDWSNDTSVFDSKIINKSNLCFLIEDTKNNKFGGVFFDKIDETNKFKIDDKTFVFSLKRNGIFNTKIFNVKQKCDAFNLYTQKERYNRLFAFGCNYINDYDIGVYKKGVDKNHCHSYKFATSEGDLIDGDKFTPKRIYPYIFYIIITDCLFNISRQLNISPLKLLFR
ncbi:hypothetical protein EIN_521260 [Entamoeba invadens IP1]|uniref:TLDc domain-containing protein n=1 Tax=Entamoeba invadens IP1 TaxID=370355 RepID=A0A0A1U9W2_ENTIV|nr:hypothetical protein EIN_521260 [Entamoeba invadens IP1]ELP91729.1 hypothetical protein EIN_521260 [Entamoeba invadens IP1]|eukprot:XP_004258500.1 hypothetical protein EIN_521260 [Entamoeba invadens IP1]